MINSYLWDFERKWRNWLMDLRVGENPLLSRVCTEEEEEEEEGEKDMSSQIGRAHV